MPDVAIIIKAKNLSKQALADLKRDVGNTAKAFEDAEVAVEDFAESGDAISRLRRDVKEARGDFGSLALAAGAISASLGFMIKGTIDAATRMDSMKRGLTAVAGSASEMEAQLVRLREVAKLPGLGLQEAIQGSINLQSVGFQAQFAERTLMAVGNALATVGKGRAELEGVMLAMTQMRAKGKVFSEEIQQMAERMPQIRKAMEMAFGTSNVELIQKMGLTVDEFLEGIIVSLEQLPSVSGGVANSFENLSDAIEEVKVQFGEVFLPTVVTVVTKLAEMIEWINNLSDTQRKMIAWSAAIVAGLATLTAGLAGFAMAIPHLISAITALGSALAFLAANPIGLAIIGALAITAAIVAYAASVDKAKYTTDKFSSSMNDLAKATTEANNIKELSDKIDELRSKTFLTNEQSAELIRLQNELARLAPELITGFDNEGNAIIGNKEAMDKYNTSLRDNIDLQKELAVTRAKRRIPELEEELKEAQTYLAALMALRERARTEGEAGIEWGEKPWYLKFLPLDLRIGKVWQEDLDELIEDLTEQNKRVMEIKEEIARFQKLIAEGIPKAKLPEPEPGPSILEDPKEAERRLKERLAAEKRAQQEIVNLRKRTAMATVGWLSYVDGFEEKFLQSSLIRKLDSVDVEWRFEKEALDNRLKEIEANENLTSETRIALREKTLDLLYTLEKKHALDIEEIWDDATRDFNSLIENIAEGWREIIEEETEETEIKISNMTQSIGNAIASIPIDLAEAMVKGESMFDAFAKSISSMLQAIAQEFQRIAAMKIALALTGDTSQGFGATESFGAFAFQALSMAVGGGFDNPVHDKMARQLGEQKAMLHGVHFANPVNDYRAQLSGAMTASKELGHRSAEDMLSHFESGFEQKSREIARGGSVANSDEILSRIESALAASANPTFRLMIDGRELEATVQRYTDRREFRQAGY